MNVQISFAYIWFGTAVPGLPTRVFPHPFLMPDSDKIRFKCATHPMTSTTMTTMDETDRACADSMKTERCTYTFNARFDCKNGKPYI